MKKYQGAIVDSEGYTVFEFTTKFCATYDAAEMQARNICAAWRAYQSNDVFQWVLEGEGS